MKQTVDVIALHQTDGSIIPLRIRLTDEEGERREFTILQYRDIGGKGNQTLPDGGCISNDTLAYECYIEVAGVRRLIRLYHKPVLQSHWTLTDAGK